MEYNIFFFFISHVAIDLHDVIALYILAANMVLPESVGSISRRGTLVIFFGIPYFVIEHLTCFVPCPTWNVFFFFFELLDRRLCEGPIKFGLVRPSVRPSLYPSVRPFA